MAGSGMARAAPPRIGETGAERCAWLRAHQDGITDMPSAVLRRYGRAPVAIQVLGLPGLFAVDGDGRIERLVCGGTGRQELSVVEQNEVLDSLDADTALVVAISPPGHSSGYREPRALALLHMPHARPR